jgi:purine nucleoside phosphorylase
MSTVPEVVVCHLLDLPVVGLSVLTNKCLDGRRVTHEAVLAAGTAAVPGIAKALRVFLGEGG